MIGLTVGLLLLAIEKSAEALSTLTGTDLSSWLHSYGKKSLEDDDYAVLQDATIDHIEAMSAAELAKVEFSFLILISLT